MVIHPADAAKLGVETSDVVRVETPEGAFEAPAVVEPTVAPGVLMVPYGMGRDSRRKAEVLRSEGSGSCEVRRRTAGACRDSGRRG
ncbi:MAG: molybdopterin dinucleotide binding domain-containing protein [Pyrobaculum sp.]